MRITNIAKRLLAERSLIDYIDAGKKLMDNIAKYENTFTGTQFAPIQSLMIPIESMRPRAISRKVWREARLRVIKKSHLFDIDSLDSFSDLTEAQQYALRGLIESPEFIAGLLADILDEVRLINLESRPEIEFVDVAI